MKHLLILGFMTFSFFSFSQTDTFFVVLNKRISSFSPELNGLRFVGDTIIEDRRCKDINDFQRLDSLQYHQNYFVFLDKKGFRIMEGIWWSENMLGKVTTYYKKGNVVKAVGEVDSEGKCGIWQYFNREGMLKKEKSFHNCNRW